MDGYKFDLAKEKHRVWVEAERKYGMMFSRDFRSRIEEDARDEQADDAEKVVLLKEEISRFMEVVSLFQPVKAATDEMPSAPIRGRYPKSFERRLYLLSFIVKAKGGLEARAGWPRITAAWNAANPSDVITPPTLKRQYHVAKKDVSVMRSLQINQWLDIMRQGEEVVESVRKDHPEWEGKTWLEVLDKLLWDNNPKWAGVSAAKFVAIMDGVKVILSRPKLGDTLFKEFVELEDSKLEIMRNLIPGFDDMTVMEILYGGANRGGK